MWAVLFVQLTETKKLSKSQLIWDCCISRKVMCIFVKSQHKQLGFVLFKIQSTFCIIFLGKTTKRCLYWWKTENIKQLKVWKYIAKSFYFYWKFLVNLYQYHNTGKIYTTTHSHARTWSSWWIRKQFIVHTSSINTIYQCYDSDIN